MLIQSFFKVTKIKKRSSAKMFKDLKEGSIIKASITISRKYNREARLIITNIETGEYAIKTINELNNILAKFVLERVENV